MARDRLDRNKNSLNKREEFLETYIRNTLNEIKDYVKRVLVLESIQEEETDKKMSIVLRELIDANFKNVNVDGYGNLVHTLLPLTDSKENDKIRRTLILYYTALYHDNVELLNKMLKEEIDFGYQLHDLYLYYLDKSITSKFEEEEYFKVIKNCGGVLNKFNFTTRDLPKEKREEYVIRFTNILKERHQDIITHSLYGDFCYLFAKKNLDNFEDASYYYATKEQLRMMSRCGDSRNINDENTKRRLNDLIQTTTFKEYYWNTDLMFGLFTDEELQGIDHWIGSYFNHFSETPEMLDKAMDLFKRNACVVKLFDRLSSETFMKIDNDILLEIYKNIDFIPNEDWIKLKAATMKPKSMIKRIFNIVHTPCLYFYKDVNLLLFSKDGVSLLWQDDRKAKFHPDRAHRKHVPSPSPRNQPPRQWHKTAIFLAKTRQLPPRLPHSIRREVLRLFQCNLWRTATAQRSWYQALQRSALPLQTSSARE